MGGGGNIYDKLNLFTLHRTEFYEYDLQLVFLPAAGLMMIQTLVEQYIGIKIFPVMHTKSNRHSIHCDVYNHYNRGPGALISFGGNDRSKGHCIATSYIGFLE